MRKTIGLFLLMYASAVYSQEPNIKFGKVSAADFEKKPYTIDTGAAAVVIYDAGSTKVKGNRDWFSLEFKIHRRIHILNKNGYEHASLEIPLYTSGENEEKLDNLKASAYNLENGKVVETKLGKDDVFKERIDKNLVVKKFTVPNVKEGTIIEWEFQITSDFLFNIQPWNFQSSIPKLWSEYRVTLPQFLNYILISQGKQQFYLADRKDKRGDFHVDQKTEGPYGMNMSQPIDFTCGISEFRWAMKDIPAMKEESYTSTTDNYVARLEFQLSGYSEPLVERKIMTTWQDLAGDLLKREDFGGQLEASLLWLPDELKPVLQGASSETEKAKKIYAYLRDQFTCTDHRGRYADQSLRSVFKKRSGNVAEINLLLTAMLRSAGIDADPVMLSTKRNGFIYPQYPLIGRFNYVISRAKVDGKDILLDASYPQLGFGKLNYECYNGKARVINPAATELDLSADQLLESQTLSVIMSHNKNEGWEATVRDAQGYYGSIETRKRIKKYAETALFDSIGKAYGNDVKIGQTSIDSLSHYDEPLVLHYTVKMPAETTDIIYLDPILTGKYKYNPFKSADRQYPVEIPYKINETYLLTLHVPDGYIVDEMPKAGMLKMNESNDASYEYNISQSGNTISLRSRLQINRTLLHPAEYDVLREFFNRIVAKQNEQIVLKKKA